MGLTKAMIKVEYGDANGSNLPGDIFEVQFNPTEYTLQKGAQIAEIGIYGLDSPILQFIRGQNEKLTLDLYFDTTAGESGEELEGRLDDSAMDVRKLTNKFYQLVKMQPNTHAPPRITFSWGEGLSFKAIVESIQQKFDLFSPNGVPLRATLSLTMREYKTLEEQIAELKPKSADHTKRYIVRRGDTFSRIAAQVYGDPREWRAIAEANPEIAKTRDLPPGSVLRIPPLDVYSKPIVTGQ